MDDLPEDENQRAPIIRFSLSRLNAHRRTLGRLTKTLDNVIASITEEYSAMLNGVGLASLSDDVLAYILELAFWNCRTFSNEESSTNDAVTLSIVCRRFRMVALSLPSLWSRVVSFAHSKKTVRMLTERSPRPNVILSTDSIDDFLVNLHPPSQWSGLELYGEFSKLKTGLKKISLASHSSFESLVHLSLYMHDPITDDWVAWTRPTVISSKAAKLLSHWSLPNVTSLMIGNVIPTQLECPSLKRLSLSLQQIRAGVPRKLDFGTLGGFLECFPLITDLSISLGNVKFINAVDHVSASGSSVPFERLENFSLRIYGSCDAISVAEIMNLINISSITKMEITLRPQNMQTDSLRRWLDSIFPSLMESDPYPRLVDFSLTVKHSEDVEINFRPIIAAIPHVRNLSLSVPGYSGIHEDVGDVLKDLQVLHLKDCNEMAVLSFFRLLHEKMTKRPDQFAKFKKLHVQRSPTSPFNKYIYGDLLKDRVVWED